MRAAKQSLCLVAVLSTGLLALAPQASALSKNTYATAFAGSGPTALVNPTAVAVDQSSHDVYVADSSLNQRQKIVIDATGGTFTLTFKGQTTGPIPHGAFLSQVRGALEALPAIGHLQEDLVVSSVGEDGKGAVAVEFTHSLGVSEQPLLTADPAGLTGGAETAEVTISQHASAVADVEKFTPAGAFVLIIGKGVDKTTGADVCTAASPDECQHGVAALAPGAFYDPNSLAVDNSPGGNGDLYVGDFVTGAGSGDVQKFDAEGNLVTSWAQGGLLDGSANPDHVTFAGTSYGFGLTSIAVNPAGDLFVAAYRHFFEYAPDGAFVRDTPSDGIRHELRPGVADLEGNPNTEAIVADSSNSVYTIIGGGGAVNEIALGTIFLDGLAPEGLELGEIIRHETGEEAKEFVGIAIEPASRDLFLTYKGGKVEHYLGSCAFVTYAEPCPPFEAFGEGDLTEPQGLALDDSTGTVFVADTGAKRVAVFDATPYAPNASASAGAHTPTSESLAGSVDPAGAGVITNCHFRYVTKAAYGKTGYSDLSTGGTTECDQPTPLAVKTPVSAEPTGLAYGTGYHFQLFAENAAGAGGSYDQEFTTLPAAPLVGAESVSGVHADAASVHAEVTPGGGEAQYHTSYRVEYLTAEQAQHNLGEGEEEFTGAESSSPLDAGSARSAQSVTAPLSKLTEGTTYRYRVVAENASGADTGAAHTFTTLPFTSELDDPCPNAHVRQQTGAALLLDCRAYELVSAADSGGYDVESNLIEGQAPFAGYPSADGRVLYGVEGGGIPGTNHPTDRGLDPYVASRGEAGWSTEYVGVPANDPGASGSAPFSSLPSAADAGLRTFAFGAPGGCSPCFAGGYTGIPVRRPNGELVQGMAGSENPGPTAEPSGYVAKPLSADGAHFLFGSTSGFESDAEAGKISIYDRDLTSGETRIVSKAPGGGNLECEIHCSSDGIAELDVSGDGSRVLLGQLVAETEGNRYWRLYMNVGDSTHTVDLTPGATHGVLYDGMTADGSRVFFTAKDALTTAADQDIDGSADIYEAEVGDGSEEEAALIRVSTGSGGTGNTNTCDPVANSAHEHWNTTSSEEDCGVVAVGGGGGVASANGAIYFLSPEKLDGAANGVQDAPNLYVARPGDGYSPHFVATLESALNGPNPPKLKRDFSHDFGSFSAASALAVEHSSGDVYVLDSGANVVDKFDSSGNPVDFTAGPGSGTNHLNGSETAAGAFAETFFGFIHPTQLAVDQSSGDFYVPDVENGVVDKFTPAGKLEKSFGVEGRVNVTFPSAAAVDPANGDLYVSGLFGEVRIFDSSGNPVSSFSLPPEKFAASIAVDSTGTVYVTYLALLSTGGTEVFTSSGELVRSLDPEPAQSVTVDSSTNDVYVDEGPRIVRFDSSGNRIETLGSGHLAGSEGVSIDPQGQLYATDASGAEVAVFTPSLAHDPLIDNPLVVDSVSEPETRRTADLELTPDGGFAAFPSTLALAGGGEETAGHAEVYRYDEGVEEFACASCSPTGEASTADSTLAQDGLSLSDRGQVFFTTADRLAAADTDNLKDVYEWEPPGTGDCASSSPSFSKTTGACLALISAGTSAFNSGLLSASADGADALFFTRDSLAPQDKNGPTMKIYDAREGGGFPYLFPVAPCKASDECHGAASPAPGPIPVGSSTITPSGHGEQSNGCKPGFVKRHGHCVKKPKHHKHHKRAKHHEHGGKK